MRFKGPKSPFKRFCLNLDKHTASQVNARHSTPLEARALSEV